MVDFKLKDKLFLNLGIKILEDTQKTISKFKNRENIKYMPNILLNKSELSLELIHSETNNQTVVNYYIDKSEKGNNVRIRFVEGDPIPFIHMKNSKYISFTECDFNGLYLGYAFLMGNEEFSEFIDDIELYFSEFIFAKKYQQNPNLSIDRLENTAEELTKIIQNQKSSEKDIENFFINNKDILELTLKLDANTFIYQPTLNDFEKKYGQNLKPDLIAYDTFIKKWTVLDYKKANINIAKNSQQVRSGIKATVHDLINQLRDYIEYFDESENRSNFKKKYKENIIKPHGIGIIGYANQNEMETIDRELRKQTQEVKIYTYNMIVDDYKRMIHKIKNYG